MLQPSKTKFRKQFKGRNYGLAQRGASVSFGEFGLKSISRGRITARQIESARRAMTRHIKRGGRIWIRVFPDKPITQKPAEVRMGNGKGNVEFWVSEIKPGKVLYEMDGVQESVAREAFRLAAAKLPLKHLLLQEILGDQMKKMELKIKMMSSLSNLFCKNQKDIVAEKIAIFTQQTTKNHIIKIKKKEIAIAKTILNMNRKKNING